MTVEIELTNDAVRDALEAALWHREYRHVRAEDRKWQIDDEGAFSRFVGEAWVTSPPHTAVDVEATAPEVWRTLRRLTRLRTRIFEVRNKPIGTVLCWDICAETFLKSLATSRSIVQRPDGSLEPMELPADRERALEFIDACVELERRLEPDSVVV